MSPFVGLRPENLEAGRTPAVVNIPEGVFPVLKTKDKSDHTGNYRGTVTGWYWHFELELQKELGATYEVFESYYWLEGTDVAGRFSQICHDLRMTDYHGAVGAIAKLLNNALYGKFAMDTPPFTLHLDLDEPEGGIPYFSPQLGEVVDCLWYVPSKPTFNPDMSHWASFITAKSREHLTRAMMAVGLDNVIYCDTDSIFFERKYIERVRHLMGDEYGLFKIEKGSEDAGVRFRAVAPKAYRYEWGGEYFVKNKGIPQRELLKQKAYDKLGKANQSIDFVQSHKLVQQIKHRKGYGKYAKRKLATENSTSNGSIVSQRWVPGTCEPRALGDIRGCDSPLFMSLAFDELYQRMSKIVVDKSESMV